MEAKTIYCPQCGRKVAVYDGKSSLNVIARCVKCRKRIVYYIDTDSVVVKPIPERVSASGLTFV